MTNLEQSILILEQALDVAAKAGAFSLKDSNAVFTAFTIVKQQFGPQEPVVEQPVEAPKVKK